jgi:hypothetical protein
MTIAVHGSQAEVALWQPTTLRELGKDEGYLEAALSRTPELLCLESRRTGIYGPFAVFNQLQLSSPQGRTISPDITLLTASGDVVIVEVKLFGNPELGDRRVIAQAIDYVASLSALDGEGMARLFNGGRPTEWTELVRKHFAEEADPDDLAATLAAKARDGDVHIVIACDKAPQGLYEMARSVSAQSHLGFSLDVVEVVPFVAKEEPADAIMFVPSVRLSTEIVARTAISVTYAEGTAAPGVTIKTTGVEEMAEGLEAAARGAIRDDRRRSWADQEIEDAMLAHEDPTVHELFRFAKAEGLPGRIQSGAPKLDAAFGFYVPVRRPDGGTTANQVFTYMNGRRSLIVYMKWPAAAIPEPVFERYRSELRALFGPIVDNPEPNIALSAIGEHLEAFKDAVRKLKNGIAPGAGA